MSTSFASAIVLAATLLACGPGPREEGHDDAPTVVVTGSRSMPLDIPLVEDNVRHDTLYVDSTFDLKDSTFMMVARGQRETFEGLRLYHYAYGPDSSARVLHASAPAYDSWTMLPTFFRPEEKGDMIILANFGERQSWGQKVMRFGPNGFTDMGFLDVAIPASDPDGQRGLKNAGPAARLSGTVSDLTVNFDTDSLYLYDDLQGHNDLIVPGKSVGYHLKDGRIFLLFNGEEREVKQPV